MRVEEIIASIHEARAEIQVLKYLQEWIINDHAEKADKIRELKATVNAAMKIARYGSNDKAALEAIANLMEES